MKNIIKLLLIIIVIVGLTFIFTKFHNTLNYNIATDNKNIKFILKYKGLKDAVDFTADGKGNYYIAYKDKIQLITSTGKSNYIYSRAGLNIKSLEYKDNRLYFSSAAEILSYDLISKKTDTLIKDLPNFGDYKDSIIRIKGNEIYVTIGAATNSGVVGNDNLWLKENKYVCDIPPFDITLKGLNFGNENNSAFSIYGTKGIKGQLISGHFPGNASIIVYNLNSKQLKTYSYGIRNVKGMDFNSQGMIIASVGGMEDRGLRPVKGDCDYIYKIVKGVWYGWPDYSGGDPVTSPRFKGKNNQSILFVLDNHPTTNPPAPIYQHKSLNTLSQIAVDKNGNLETKDSTLFYDIGCKTVFNLDTSGIITEVLNFDAGSLSSMKFINNNLIIMDSSRGLLYSIVKK
jgi:hypothetical protein